MSMRYWQVSVVCALALAGCGAKTAGTSAAPAAAAAGASGCHAFEAGKDGVMRTFCDGRVRRPSPSAR